jgi:predicted HicB family RNase H-like nuclease
MNAINQTHISESQYLNECDRRNQESRKEYQRQIREAAVVEAERKYGWMSIEAADARSAYQGTR